MVATPRMAEFLTVSGDAASVDMHNVPEINHRDTPHGIKGNNKPDLIIKLGQHLNELKDMMKAAEVRFDDYARQNLQRLVDMFPSQKTTIQRVKLPQELVDHYGGDAKALEFGAINLNGDEHFKQLQGHVELAKKYFGDDIHLHRITYDDGRPPVAIVMNVKAEHFNAVVMAERKKAQLEHDILQARREIPGMTTEHEASMDKAAQLASKAINFAPERVAAAPSYAAGQAKETEIGRA